MEITIYYQTIDSFTVEVDDKFIALSEKKNNELKDELNSIVRKELICHGIDSCDMTEVCDNDSGSTLMNNCGY